VTAKRSQVDRIGLQLFLAEDRRGGRAVITLWSSRRPHNDAWAGERRARWKC